MPWENIGSCGSGQLPDDREWIVQCNELALSYLNFIIGDPPEGCELGIVWHEHELGDYPSIGLHWDYPQSDPPWKFINKCEIVLERFDSSIDWPEIAPAAILEEMEGEEDNE